MRTQARARARNLEKLRANLYYHNIIWLKYRYFSKNKNKTNSSIVCRDYIILYNCLIKFGIST